MDSGPPHIRNSTNGILKILLTIYCITFNNNYNLKILPLLPPIDEGQTDEREPLNVTQVSNDHVSDGTSTTNEERTMNENLPTDEDDVDQVDYYKKYLLSPKAHEILTLKEEAEQKKDDSRNSDSSDASTSNDKLSKTEDENLAAGNQDMYPHLDEGDILNDRKKNSFANRKICGGFNNQTKFRVAIESIETEYLSKKMQIDLKNNIFEKLRKIKHNNVIAGDYYCEWNEPNW